MTQNCHFTGWLPTLRRVPDEENTPATAVFTLDANHVRWQIFDINRDDAKFHGEVRG